MADQTQDQTRTIAFLGSGKTHGVADDDVTRHETHGAIVFLAKDRAFKLKRAVKYPYLDSSSAQKRKALCEAELRVNRRTAPQLYLEVRAIVPDDDGLRFGTAEESDRAIDWVVVMRRFDQDNLMEQMRRRGALTPELMRALGETIATFHAKAERQSAYGGAEAMARTIDGNLSILNEKNSAPFDAQKIEQLATLSRERLKSVSGLLDRRRENGFVRRCHGDMHLNNICVLDGSPVLFDAIEFNEDFACIDTLYDIAFTLMDLDRHDLRKLANRLFNRYLEITGDYDGLAALPLFLSCRAALRAHVTMTMAEKSGGRTDASDSEATALLDLAIAYLQPPAPHMVAMGGVSGTGKSTLAFALAPVLGAAPGAIVLRSDVIRKELMGVTETERLPQSAYSADVTARVYATMQSRSAHSLESGHSAIADAAHGKPEERAEIARIAGQAGAPFTGLWLSAPTATLEQRIAARHGDASDATIAVLHAQLKSFIVPDDWAQIDVSGETRAALEAAIRALPASGRKKAGNPS